MIIYNTSYGRFTDEDDRIIKVMFPLQCTHKLAGYMGKRVDAIVQRAKYLGVY